MERVNRFLRSTLAKITDSLSDWEEKLSLAHHVINNSYHKAIDSTPSKALFGFAQRREEDENLRKLMDEVRKLDDNYEQQREKIQDTAQEVNQLQEYNKMYYDKKHKKPSQYKEGDLVLVRKQAKPGENTKLLPKYKGPYQVKTVLNKNRYVITDVPTRV